MESGVKKTVWRPESLTIWSLQAENLFIAISGLYIMETMVRALNSNFRTLINKDYRGSQFSKIRS